MSAEPFIRFLDRYAQTKRLSERAQLLWALEQKVVAADAKLLQSRSNTDCKIAQEVSQLTLTTSDQAVVHEDVEEDVDGMTFEEYLSQHPRSSTHLHKLSAINQEGGRVIWNSVSFQRPELVAYLHRLLKAKLHLPPFFAPSTLAEASANAFGSDYLAFYLLRNGKHTQTKQDNTSDSGSSSSSSSSSSSPTPSLPFVNIRGLEPGESDIYGTNAYTAAFKSGRFFLADRIVYYCIQAGRQDKMVQQTKASMKQHTQAHRTQALRDRNRVMNWFISDEELERHESESDEQQVEIDPFELDTDQTLVFAYIKPHTVEEMFQQLDVQDDLDHLASSVNHHSDSTVTSSSATAGAVLSSPSTYSSLPTHAQVIRALIVAASYANYSTFKRMLELLHTQPLQIKSPSSSSSSSASITDESSSLYFSFTPEDLSSFLSYLTELLENEDLLEQLETMNQPRVITQLKWNAILDVFHRYVNLLSDADLPMLQKDGLSHDLDLSTTQEMSDNEKKVISLETEVCNTKIKSLLLQQQYMSGENGIEQEFKINEEQEEKDKTNDEVNSSASETPCAMNDAYMRPCICHRMLCCLPERQTKCWWPCHTCGQVICLSCKKSSVAGLCAVCEQVNELDRAVGILRRHNKAKFEENDLEDKDMPDVEEVSEEADQFPSAESDEENEDENLADTVIPEGDE